MFALQETLKNVRVLEPLTSIGSMLRFGYRQSQTLTTYTYCLQIMFQQMWLFKNQYQFVKKLITFLVV